MKPMQAALLLVILVVMVFAVTFASMYVRDAPTKKTAEEEAQKPQLKLTFASTQVPEERDPSRLVVTEFDKRGHHEFWFRNDNDQAVLLGLGEKSCQCSDVKVFIAPSDWRYPLAEAEARRKNLMKYEGILPGGGAGKLVAELADDLGKAEVEQTRQQLLARADLRSLTTLDSSSAEGVEVPPGAVGFVRLEWEWDKRQVWAGPQKGLGLSAKLWMQDARTGPEVKLFAAVLYVEPACLDKGELRFGALNPHDTKTDTVYCWSPTRADFRLEARPAERRLSPFVHCEAEKLSEQERQQLRKPLGPIAAGYRVTISMRERLDERTRFDEGPFEHGVDLLPFDGKEKLKPLHVTLQGRVRGDVLVPGAEGGIHLEKFPANRGTTHEVLLSTQQPDLDLKLDSHPPFMAVDLTKEKTSSGPRWKLRLEIGRDQVAGSFPRADHQAYKDTAIYLKIGGEGSRRLRIPVSGTATQ